MIFEPGLTRHPKFRGLANRLGGEGMAFSVLFRLWEHCQVNKKGERWGKVSAEYLAEVCEWKGDGEVLKRALLTPIEEAAHGWIEFDKDGRMRVHEWERANAGLVTCWRNGRKGGRPRKPSGSGGLGDGACKANRKETRRKPIDRLDRQDRSTVPPTPLEGVLGGVEGSMDLDPGGEKKAAGTDGKQGRVARRDARLPGSVEEVIAAGAALVPAVGEGTCREFWSFYEGQAGEGPNGERFWRTSGGGLITNWRAKLAGFGGSTLRFGPGAAGNGNLKNGAGAGPGAGRQAELEELHRIDCRLQGARRETFGEGVMAWDALVARETELRERLNPGGSR